MSTKNFPEETHLWLFLIASLGLHIAVVSFFLYVAPKTALFSPVRKRMPRVIQIVELPPGYKAPATKKKPRAARRFADRTSVMEKESIPEVKTVPAKPVKRAAGGPGKFAIKRPAGPSAPEGGKTAKKAAGTVSEAAAGRPEESGPVPHEAIPVKRSIPAKTTGPVKRAHENEGKGEAAFKEGSPGAAAGGPKLLLPREKIAELEKNYRLSPQKRERSKTLLLNTSELKYQKYLVDVKNRIQLYWEYPMAAVRNGWEGRLNIDFIIKRDGSLEVVDIKRSSRYPVLDDAAITALKLASPFAPFPDDFEINEIRIHGQFVYNIITLPPR